MGERPVNPIQNIHPSKKYKEVIYINPYRFGNGVDADAQAFITAAGISNTTQENAIKTLVSDLKLNNLWSKFVAIYPFVGGNASSHKYNLKDARDLDAAFRLTFSGTITHDSNGWVGNGSNTFANTHVLPSTSLSLNSTHVSVYLNTTNSSDQADVGHLESSPSSNFIQMGANLGGAMNIAVNASGGTSLAHTNSGGFYLASRSTHDQQKGYKNGTLLGTGSVTSLRLSALKIYLGARNQNGTAQLCSSRKQSFATIGQGLTDSEVSTLYTIVQAYQTSLSRQV